MLLHALTATFPSCHFPPLSSWRGQVTQHSTTFLTHREKRERTKPGQNQLCFFVLKKNCMNCTGHIRSAILLPFFSCAHRAAMICHVLWGGSSPGHGGEWHRGPLAAQFSNLEQEQSNLHHQPPCEYVSTKCQAGNLTLGHASGIPTQKAPPGSMHKLSLAPEPQVYQQKETK